MLNEIMYHCFRTVLVVPLVSFALSQDGGFLWVWWGTRARLRKALHWLTAYLRAAYKSICRPMWTWARCIFVSLSLMFVWRWSYFRDYAWDHHAWTGSNKDLATSLKQKLRYFWLFMRRQGKHVCNEYCTPATSWTVTRVKWTSHARITTYYPLKYSRSQ